MHLAKERLLLLLLICAGVWQQCGNETPTEYRKLFRLPVEQQAKEFKKYPLETQLDIYLHAMQGVEPPATQFAEFLASNGKQVIPLLLNRLKAEERDKFRYYFISVFDEMHESYFNLKDEKEVVETIRTTISKMKDPDYLELCEIFLKKILK
jgi:hypothetical protein